jgi:hypothetical protein
MPIGGDYDLEPVVDAFTPVVWDGGGNIISYISKDAALGFNVTDDSGALKRIIVELIGEELSEIIYDGVSFSSLYLAGSSKSAIANGFNFSIRRTGGWQEDPYLGVFAIDEGGLENNNGVRVLRDPNTAPVVGSYFPTVGSDIGKTDTLSLSVTDDSGVFRRLLVYVEQIGAKEVVHDGLEFRPPYLDSTKLPITGGHRFSIRRAGGWVTSPTVVVVPIDQQGLIGESSGGWNLQ